VVETLNDPKAEWERRDSAAHSLMDRAFGKPPQAIEGHFQENRQQIVEIRWLPPDPADRSRVIEPEPDEGPSRGMLRESEKSA
jgi:hypothetical protein